jgi:hypothetical protein
VWTWTWKTIQNSKGPNLSYLYTYKGPNYIASAHQTWAQAMSGWPFTHTQLKTNYDKVSFLSPKEKKEKKKQQ